MYMIDATQKLNERQKFILITLSQKRNYTLSEIMKLFGSQEKSPSTATLRRDLSNLCSLNFLKQEGKLKSTTYKLTIPGMIKSPINAHEYLQTEIDKRNGDSSYNFLLFNNFPNKIFSTENNNKFNIATNNFKTKSLGISNVVMEKELERFVIELSWKSSKIEGNTYTLLDTELLLKKGIKVKNHNENEALMILNHKKAFQYILSIKEKFKKLDIRLIEDIHKLLMADLGVSFNLRAKPVGVTGSKYVPLSVPTQIREALKELLETTNKIKSPYDKALLILTGISYIQPFEDGNKRTARLITNAILMAYECAPLSYRNVDEIQYKENMITFYEKNSIIPISNIFKEQYLFACENYLKF